MDGRWDAHFDTLADVLADGFGKEELGASCALYVRGKTVFHAWGGLADRRTERPWLENSLACAFSVTKAFSSLIALHAVAKGALTLDDPLSRWWPEFAAADKGAISLRQLLAHQAGVVGSRKPLLPDDYYTSRPMAQQLAAEPAWWAPGTAHGYHARTLGLLLDQVLLRSVGEDVAGALMAVAKTVDQQQAFYLGMPEEALSRCVTLEPARATGAELRSLPESTWRMLKAMADTSTPTGAAFQNPKLPRKFMNERSFKRRALASSSLHGTASAMAMVFQALWHQLPSGLKGEAITSQSQGFDQVLLTHSCFGLGLMLETGGEERTNGFGHGSFGHVGSGGAVLFHQPAADATFVFLPNRLRAGVMRWGPTAQALMTEARRQLG